MSERNGGASPAGSDKFGYGPGDEVTYYDGEGRELSGKEFLEDLGRETEEDREARRIWVEKFRAGVEGGATTEEAGRAADEVPGSRRPGGV